MKANSIMNQVSKDVETNMSQNQINALIKHQLNKNPKWTIQSVAAQGYNSEGYCYSSGYDTLLSVVEPDYEQVDDIIDLINVVEEEGGTLTEGEALN